VRAEILLIGNLSQEVGKGRRVAVKTVGGEISSNLLLLLHFILLVLHNFTRISSIEVKK
jgi:hypothetical protein